IRMICLVVMVVCLFKLGQAYYLSAQNKAEQEALRDMVQAVEEDDSSENSEQDEPAAEDIETQADEVEAQGTENETPIKGDSAQTGSGIPGEEGGYPILRKYTDLYRENGDVAGWLSIEGTRIDYPVMQCEDDEYYLHHDFYGEESKYGCLYVRGRADLEDGTNFVIYGHNMKDGSMFGDLDLYQQEEFYREHSLISFDTLYEERTYEIVAAFPSQVYDEDAEEFKYYQFYEAETEEEFNEFYENIKALSLYDTGVTAEFGDTFLTLSTCAYHVNDGRFVVVGKRR
ncbi:MAG: class B sortase, partial [Lachnospiraceae bacterium]|nr:class B sortase [Lachnospiraceae bacterium]